MRRKLIRMACFLAFSFVIGILVSGCKDYDGDINNLQKQVDQIKSDIASLENSVGKYVQSVTYNASTGVLTVTGGDGSSASATITQNLPTYTISANGTTIQLIKNGQVVSEANITLPNSAVFDATQLVVKEGKVYYGDVATGVVIPENGFIAELRDNDGNVLGYTIGADDVYADFYIQDAIPLKSVVFKPVSYLGGIEAMPAVEIIYNALTANAYPTPTTSGESWTASVNVTEMYPECVAEYHLNPSSVTAKQIKSLAFLAEEKDYVSVRGNSFSPVVDSFSVNDGILKVYFKANDVKGQDMPLLQPLDTKVCVMALQVTTQFIKKDNIVENKIITSDYAAVYPDVWDGLFFVYTADAADHINDANQVIAGNIINGSVDLEALQAIDNNPTYFLNYVNDRVDVTKLVQIKYDDNKYISTDDLSKYDMSVTYSLSDYLGDATSNGTAQNNFASLTPEGILTAKVYDQSGAAAVGRMPMVRYTLYDDINNEVINVGWIKFIIVDNVTVDIDFDATTYGCNGARYVVDVRKMNESVYNVLGLSKAAFHQTYNAFTYSGSGSAVSSNPDDYATETAIITWTLDNNDIDLTKPDSVYTISCVYSNSSNRAQKVFINLSAKIAGAPSASLDQSSKISEYWYDNLSSIRINVSAPTSGTDSNPDNCIFSSDLDAVFVSNIPVIIPNDNNSADFKNLNYTYAFDGSNNDRVVKSASGESFVLSVDNDVNLCASANGTGADEVIATINESNGVIEYNENSVNAKKILNVSAHNVNPFFAYISVLAYNPDCPDLVMTAETFTAKFLRPINMSGISDRYFEDAKDGGDTLNIADLVNFTDWRNISFMPDHSNYFGFYGVTRIEMVKDSITTNLNGGTLGKSYLDDITELIQFTQTNNTQTIPGTNVQCGQIVYKNNGFNIQQFKVRIPFKVTYKWGELHSFIDMDVKHTVANPAM